MPVEIRELIIRAVVNNDNREQRGEDEPSPQNQNAVDSKAIIEECVKQVLKILKKSKER